MRQQTIIKDGRFVTGWHFDSRDDFLQNGPRLPSSMREEYESQFPPPTSSPPSSPSSPSTPPPPPPTSQPVLILRAPQSGRLYHICPPTHPQMLRKQWAAMLQRRKIFLRGEAWKGVTLGELAAICARRVGALEGWTRLGVGVGDISLGFCGVKVGREITIGELIDFARVRLEEPDEGVWECPVFLEVGIHKASTTVAGCGDDERSRKKRRKGEGEVEVEVEDTIQPSLIASPSSGTIAGYLGLARGERHGG
ncbi:unnamed protein product [Tuber melanosporum]|uniref:(Perigord truffle) hypothetical protein n=1 Tax=Tuber melanosporum (strain Mel28) TaxID=656061 RepID=D5GCS2_TUBMM|nr:uncharacterized protein GSTUM_00005995001 [Tuber melanosporum]CAZ82315.1 unnamed protein product [Tuber melanosporum]